ncbi:MAG: MFS transporter [Thermoplasmata archaeon]
MLRSVYGATFFVRFAFGLTVSIFAAYISGHFTGLSGGEVGLVGAITAAAPIGEFSTVLFSGIQADRFGRFPILLAGMGGAAGTFLLVSLTRSGPLLSVANLLFGVASGAILAASLAVVADQSERTGRGRAMGRFDSMNLLGWVLGFSVGFGVLGTIPNGDLPWVFRLGALALGSGLLFVLWEVRGLTESGRRTSVDLQEIRDAVLRRDVLLVALPWLVIYMLIGAAFAYLGSAGSGIGVAPWELAVLIGVGGLALLLTQPFFGGLADRFGRFPLMVVGTAGFLGLMVSLVAITTWGARPELLGAIGLSAIAALAYGPAALAALGDLSRLMTRGTTMALYSLVISVGMILGLLVVTALFSAFGNRGIDLFFGLLAVGLLTLTLLRGLDLRRGRLSPSAAPEGRTLPDDR